MIYIPASNKTIFSLEFEGSPLEYLNKPYQSWKIMESIHWNEAILMQIGVTIPFSIVFVLFAEVNSEIHFDLYCPFHGFVTVETDGLHEGKTDRIGNRRHYRAL